MESTPEVLYQIAHEMYDTYGPSFLRMVQDNGRGVVEILTWSPFVNSVVLRAGIYEDTWNMLTPKEFSEKWLKGLPTREDEKRNIARALALRDAGAERKV